MKAVVAEPLGGPENLKLIDVPRPTAGLGEVVVKLEASGVNFVDVYHRTGLYKVPEMPVRLGNEGAGIVEEAAPDTGFEVGQRIAYAMARGSYAEYAVVPARFTAVVPEAVSLKDAAAVMLQGMTAHYLTHSTFALGPGSVCLVHAAAGGTGSLIVQMAKIVGARVIGTVSTEDKAILAEGNGADDVILYTKEDFVGAVKRLTGGRGVDVVYDSVGGDTFLKGLDCLRPRGMMVSFGQSSGPAGALDPLVLSQKGSLFLTRPTLANYISDLTEMRARTADIFNWMAEERLRVNVFKIYPLAEAAEAHRDLEGRRTTGKLLLEL